jgi:hypothetical protein
MHICERERPRWMTKTAHCSTPTVDLSGLLFLPRKLTFYEALWIIGGGLVYPSRHIALELRCPRCPLALCFPRPRAQMHPRLPPRYLACHQMPCTMVHLPIILPQTDSEYKSRCANSLGRGPPTRSFALNTCMAPPFCLGKGRICSTTRRPTPYFHHCSERHMPSSTLS